MIFLTECDFRCKAALHPIVQQEKKKKSDPEVCYPQARFKICARTFLPLLSVLESLGLSQIVKGLFGFSWI